MANRIDEVTAPRRIVIVGASLAGLRAAETLRLEGFSGQLTLIGDEPYPPYDRPPLSKQVLSGWLPVDHITLPVQVKLDARWLLGVPAKRLDMLKRQVVLADGQTADFDYLLIATGTRARPWPDADEAALEGVCSVRNRDDASKLYKLLSQKPQRVLVVGGGFIGSEVASVCRDLGLEVTLAERGPAPLGGALGTTIGSIVAREQRKYGVDLRVNTVVTALEGNGQGRLRGAQLSDGSTVEADVAVIALGALRNVEWLFKANLSADERGVVCDTYCRALDNKGDVVENIFVAGDIARWPHPLFHYEEELLAVEHWGNAIDQAETAAHNMLNPSFDYRPHTHMPNFWSSMFGASIKSVGLPTVADQVVITQASFGMRRFTAVYGRQGKVVAAVSFNAGQMLPSYQTLVEQSAPFPPDLHASDQPQTFAPQSAGFPHAGHPKYDTGAEPNMVTP
ncbi:NAD(P)/FAD-dependent oxidoreductase [Dictyobacter arantiisoli]|uniref:Pyridine nucleotide-disulfide oxidoreductase n=1 Tax=Dictyobacter arantiisoli TaxID=2014874 RepID=A0A5A5THT9_9CHLR|nr:FAD/NAD(P)-binding oxidoreductase [Dictyobacter arantiisoli]GCF10623.1 pyridine nucleotide-disulfide oxidoreductase [Dictyobacter arantiisoli]